MKRRVKMSRIGAAFAKCKVVDSVFKLRRRKVESTFEVARINLKDQRADEELKIEELIKEFANPNCEYSHTLDKITERYGNINKIERTIETLDKLEKYINEEVEVELKDSDKDEELWSCI